MFEKEADEYVVTTGNNDCTIDAYKDGAEFGYNKAKEEIRKELLELRADSFDAGMFLRVDEILRKLGIKED